MTEDEVTTALLDRKRAEMVARLRALAGELRWANDLYQYATEYGMWNPANAEYEATYLEWNP